MMTISVNQLRRQWGSMVRAVSDENRPVLVTRRGSNLAVFLPYQTYERLLPLLEDDDAPAPDDKPPA